ncbi:MAG TPA: hypothetical protein VKX17_10595 [Planctomycetota bacterium]|nr:hypothetical protein [Planctomycetota bacterium]
MRTQNNTAPNREVDRETEALRAATRRHRAARAAIESENTALNALLLKQKKFVRQMERVLTSAEKRRQALKREKEQILHSAAGARP